MSNYQKLERLLTKEIEIQKQLSELLDEEKQAVLKSNHEQLGASEQKKKDLLVKAKEVELQRKSVTDLLSKDKPAKLSDLIEKCPDASSQAKLSQIRDQLKDIATEVSGKNTYNGKLMRETLGLVATTLSIFRSPPGEDLPTYTASGKVKDEKKEPSKGLIEKA